MPGVPACASNNSHKSGQFHPPPSRRAMQPDSLGGEAVGGETAGGEASSEGTSPDAGDSPDAASPEVTSPVAADGGEALTDAGGGGEAETTW